MRRLLVITLCVAASLPARSAVEPWKKWFSSDLRRLETSRLRAAKELEDLGNPVTGQTSAEFGYQHLRLSSSPANPAWVQVDLKQRRRIDAVALLPAQVDWRSPDRPAYGFPRRFLVEISDDAACKQSTIAGTFTNADFPDPGVAPVTINCGGKIGRFVRLTVTKMAEENRQFFYALSELMVISGNLDVAVGCPVRASASFDLPPRWAMTNLVDGRSFLGPPIRRELTNWDGLYAIPGADHRPPWFQLDLGRTFSLQQIRLHPIHARFGADVPGFAFPKAFRLEASENEDFSAAALLFASEDYPNPGNNPVTLWANDTPGRYLRVTSLATNAQGEMRFGLSEIEAYSGDTNVARTAVVTRPTPDPMGRSTNWPPSLLVDGFTSYGRLMELPAWLRDWERRRELQAEVKRIEAEEIATEPAAQRRAAWTASGAAISGSVAICGLVVLTRHRRNRELHDLRLRLARDIHDDIGSNLAGIAVLSEVARESEATNSAHREDWHEVNRIAHETLDAVREMVWLIGGRDEAGLDLIKHLQIAASRMLAGKEVRWSLGSEPLPPEWPLESRRQVFLFFKEALANIVRHSQATRVDLSAEVKQHRFLLTVKDNGGGFNDDHGRRGTGLNSQQMRARALGGTAKLKTAPGEGTTVSLEVPVGTGRRLFHFGNHEGKSVC